MYIQVDSNTQIEVRKNETKEEALARYNKARYIKDRNLKRELTRKTSGTPMKKQQRTKDSIFDVIF